MLVVDELDETTVECAAALVAREHAAACRMRPELPAASAVPTSARPRCGGYVAAGIAAWSRPTTGAWSRS